MNNKADRSEMQQLESKLLEKLNEMLKKFLSIFADKKDTHKRLSNLEKNVTIIDFHITDETYL